MYRKNSLVDGFYVKVVFYFFSLSKDDKNATYLLWKWFSALNTDSLLKTTVQAHTLLRLKTLIYLRRNCLFIYLLQFNGLLHWYIQSNEKRTYGKKGHKDGQQKSHRPHARLTTLNIKRTTEGNYK